VSADLSGASQPGRVPISGPGLLLSWPAAAAVSVSFSLDAVLAGMVAAGQGIHAICLYLGLTRAVLDEHLVRLGLRTPHERPLRRPGPRGWSVLDTIRLIAWRVAGIHPEAIAQRLGRSANAVRAKARRLGLPRPDRKALQRVDPATLEDPVPGFGVSRETADREPLPRSLSPSVVCGTSAGSVSVRVGDGAPGMADLGARLPTSEPPSAARVCHGEVNGQSGGRSELPLFPVVPEAETVRTPIADSAPGSGLAGQKRDRAIGKEAARGPEGQPELPLFPEISGSGSPAKPQGPFAGEHAGRGLSFGRFAVDRHCQKAARQPGNRVGARDAVFRRPALDKDCGADREDPARNGVVAAPVLGAARPGPQQVWRCLRRGGGAGDARELRL